MNEPIPTAFHPWEFIEEELQERGWTKDRLALEMSVGETAALATAVDVQVLVLEILEHVRDPGVVIGDETDGRLCHAFGVTPGLFKNLHAAWLKSLSPRREQ